jgi:hypothetical protein
MLKLLPGWKDLAPNEKVKPVPVKLQRIVLLAFLCYLPGVFASDSTPTQKSHKSNYDNEEGFAAPGSTARQIEEDDEEKTPVLRFPFFDEALQPWFDY